jgi:hypothetical protein
MKNQEKCIPLNRTAFIKEMRKDSFARYTLFKNGKLISLVATDANGTDFILGSFAGQPRYWSDMNNPTKFLEESGIFEFCITIEGESC